MPAATPDNDDRPTLFCLHFLGGSGRSWGGVTRALGDAAECVLIDLPGFGAASAQPGYAVGAMADAIVAIIRSHGAKRWMIAGHSMGCKVAAALARRAEDGAAGLEGLAGLVLVAGSPPSPEPMSEERRQRMLGWFTAGPAESQRQAEDYISGGASTDLDGDARAQAVADVLRLHPAAWRAWLDSGSREDWAERIGVLQTPALIVSGADDEDLGPDAQQTLMARHFTTVQHVTIPGAGHLLPLEVPAELARLIADFIVSPEGGQGISPAYRALIESGRVSQRTRSLLMARAAPDDPHAQPRVLTVAELTTLRSVLARVVPQTGFIIDLAARIDANLAAGLGDGWRFAALPQDPAAYRAALRTLDAAAAPGFAGMSGRDQDQLLTRVAAGECEANGPGLLSARQMQLWFEDLRSDAVRLYVAHPATLGRMGYSGIGYGGDGPGKPGFHAIGPEEREMWEPVAEGAAS
jgi:pimeloyl-ACP methyl ester carboxylesterase